MAITQAKVLSVITSYGVDAVFVTITGNTYSPTTGLTATGTSTNHTHKIIPPYKMSLPDAAAQFGKIDGISSMDYFSIVAASGLTFTPYVGQKLTWDSKTWSIVAVNPIRSNVGVLAYEFAFKV